jgi:hypothetical protein
MDDRYIYTGISAANFPNVSTILYFLDFHKLGCKMLGDRQININQTISSDSHYETQKVA